MIGNFSRYSKGFILTIILGIFMSLPLFTEGTAEETEYLSFSGRHQAEWRLDATDPLLIGGYGDNFAYDGKMVKPLDGNAFIDINAESNRGRMEAVFNGTINPEKDKTFSGEIKLVYNKFSEGPAFFEGGIADFIYLHGDTSQEAPVMPRIKSYLASWGTVDVYVDENLIYKDLVGHMMYTEGSRDRDNYAIYNNDRSGFYSAGDPSNGSIAEPGKSELHFVAHTTEADSGNFPPHTVWIHLNYLNVTEK